MRRIALPTLLYIDVADGEEAAEIAERVRDWLDQPTATSVVLAGVPGRTRLHVDRDRPVRTVEPYGVPAGQTRYEVVLEMTVDGSVTVPEDWPEDDAPPGEYSFSVRARNAFEAVEAARDAFSDRHAIKILDRVVLDPVSIERVG